MKAFIFLFLVLFAIKSANAQYIIYPDLKENYKATVSESSIIKPLDTKEKKSLRSKFLEKGWFTNLNGSEFWKQNNTLRGAMLTIDGSNETGSLYADLVSDTKGLFRFTFSSVITAANEGEEKKDLQTFLNGGGNSILRVDFPLFYAANLAKGPDNKEYNTEFLAWYFMPRISAMLPALGSATDEVTGSLDFGTEIQAGFKTDNKNFGFSGRIRVAGVWCSKNIANLILEKQNREGFAYGQASLSFEIKTFMILLNYPIMFLSGKKKETFPITLSVGSSF